MTQEEKARAYDEALKRAKRMFSEKELNYLFPELQKSEDERIRKAIHIYLDWLDGKKGCAPKGGYSIRDMIAWLEKQGEQKLADKGKPKFHEGDWIIHQGTENIYQVVARIDNQYQLKYGDNYTIQKCADVDRCARLWDITKDAKDGDVLCYKDEISLYKYDIRNCTKQETTFGGFVYYCCYDGKRFIMDSFYSLTEQDKIDIHPATKEQRNTLFAVMKKAGYEWNAENKELKGIEKSSAWSEEDEAGLGDALWAIEQARTIAKNENEMGNLWYAERWLKSIKQRLE